MNTPLYPLKFVPQFLDKIWGGHKIKTVLGKDYSPLPNCGETWELSGVAGRISVVENGPLAGKPLDELINEYGGELMGTTVHEMYGHEFPLLIKFIDAAEDLSIQVHPGDELAAERHNGKGKTEMWFILDADPGATLIAGFNQPMNREKYLDYFENGKLEEVLNREPVSAGDVFFIPAGRIHTIGKGILLAEIQQTSDITYRIYDFDRRDAAGNLRELHTDQALDALDFRHYPEYKSQYNDTADERNTVVDSRYFHTSFLRLHKPMTLTGDRQRFRILIVTAGQGVIRWKDQHQSLKMGDVYLVPAIMSSVTLVPDQELIALEVTP